MNLIEATELVNQLLEKHRIEVGDLPDVAPIVWKGIDMTVQEAKLVIQELESSKLKHQNSMNGTQTGGEVTKLAVGGTGLAAMVTGTALMLFPPTAIAGAITLTSGIGTAAVGKMVGEGVKEIGTNKHVQAIQQIDTYIDSIKSAIIELI